MTRAILEQIRISVPDLHINSMQTIAMPAVAGAGAIAFMIAMSSIIGFPLPFALVVGIPVWFVVVLICFMCCLYPAYLYGFIQVQPSNQKFYLVLLPIIKLIAKNWISHWTPSKNDLCFCISLYLLRRK